MKKERWSQGHARARVGLAVAAWLFLTAGLVFTPWREADLSGIPFFPRPRFDPFANFIWTRLGLLGGAAFLVWELLTYKSLGRLRWWFIRLLIVLPVFFLVAGGVWWLGLRITLALVEIGFAGGVSGMLVLILLSVYSARLYSRDRFPSTRLNAFAMALGFTVPLLLACLFWGGPFSSKDLLLKEAALGHAAHIRILTAIGFDVNVRHRHLSFFAPDYEMTPLLEAVENGHTEAALELIKAGAEVNFDAFGITALMLAAGNGDGTLVKVLLDADADVNAKDIDGDTALMMAEREGHTDIIELLKKAGAVDERIVDKKTPLMRAAETGDAEVIQALLDGGADANAKDENGTTVLMYAAEWGVWPNVQVLLEAGADVQAKNEDGKTALMIAEAGGHTEIVELLKKSGAEE